MTLDEFFKMLENDVYEDKIVRLAYKYDFEKEYTYSNEILECENGHYYWLNDWDEGQTDIKVIGYLNISNYKIAKILIPL